MSEATNEEILPGLPGIEQSQGYIPLPPAGPVPDGASDDLTIEEAVEQRVGSGEIPVTERRYVDTRTGAPRADNETVPIDRAAADIGRIRDDERRSRERARAQELNIALDAGLSPLGVATEIEKAKGPEQQQAQPQAEPLDQQAQQQQKNDRLAEVFQREPVVLEAVRTHIAAVEQRAAQVVQQVQQQAQQVVQVAETFTEDSARQALFAMWASFPELENVPLRDVPVALNLMQRQNPERAAAALNHYARTQAFEDRWLHQQQQRAVQEAHQYQRNWATWSNEEDNKFVQAFPETADPVKQSQVAARAQSYLQNSGLTRDDIERLWSGRASLSLRDHRAQAILFDAMRYREAVAGMPATRRNSIARVQRPGSAGNVARQQDVDMHSLSSRLNNARGNDAIRAGADIIAQRRARSR